MKCKWQECGNDARIKSPFCSEACKKRYQRAGGTELTTGGTSSGTDSASSGTNEVGQTQVGQTAGSGDPAIFDCDHRHCQAAKARGRNTVTHTYMDAGQIQSHFDRTKERMVNRVSLPGDADYSGVAL